MLSLLSKSRMAAQRAWADARLELRAATRHEAKMYFPPFHGAGRAIFAATLISLALAGCAATPPVDTTATGAIEEGPKTAMDASIARYAALYQVPETLIRRSIRRESGYNPKARNGPYWGLMQIRYDTAQGMGYRGPARGLLDADTNLTYAVAYLANAYMVAGGNDDRAIALYAGGYYYEARRKGLLEKLTVAQE
jgi:soluble lytic murein transglycosylase-like protein